MSTSLVVKNLARSSAPKRLWRLATQHKAASVTARCLSSVSPVFRHDEDEHNEDHHENIRRGQPFHRPQNVKRPIKVQTPPILKENSITMDVPSASKDVLQSAPPFESPSDIKYTGDATIPITSRLHMVKPGEDAPPGTWPVFRLMVSEVHTRHRTILVARI
jgi:hypothetical protein